MSKQTQNDDSDIDDLLDGKREREREHMLIAGVLIHKKMSWIP